MTLGVARAPFARSGVLAALTILCTSLAAPAAAQGSDSGNGMRFGISFGGISTVGVVVEWFWDTHAVEVGLGTWSFGDVAVSTVYKEYIGGRALRPFVGGGLWTVLAWPEGERTGFALVLRAPVGVDWNAVDEHSVGAVLNLNRALWVRRTDPQDDLPLNRRIVPLPEVYYRLTR